VTAEAAPRRGRGRPATTSRKAILDAVEPRLGGEWSVPMIAADLGISHSAIYRYFPTKSALMTAACDRVFADLQVPPARDWREWLMGLGLAWRGMLLRHPFMVDLAQWSVTARPTQVNKIDPGIEILMAAGFTPLDALEVISAVTALSQVLAASEVVATTKELPPTPFSPLISSIIASAEPKSGEQALRDAIMLVIDGAERRLERSRADHDEPPSTLAAKGSR
jgi:TetR/AcrR family tetracycline transcriptional repressor